jgi:hypothetical protein
LPGHHRPETLFSVRPAVLTPTQTVANGGFPEIAFAAIKRKWSSRCSVSIY